MIVSIWISLIKRLRFKNLLSLCIKILDWQFRVFVVGNFRDIGILKTIFVKGRCFAIIVFKV